MTLKFRVLFVRLEFRIVEKKNVAEEEILANIFSEQEKPGPDQEGGGSWTIGPYCA